MCWFAPLAIIPTFVILDYVFPGQVKNVVMRTGWKALEICSKVETYFTNTYYHYQPYLIAFLQKKEESRITFIHKGEEIVKYSVQEFLRNTIKNKIDFSYDFLLHEIPILMVGKYDKYDRYTIRYENHKSLTCDKFYEPNNDSVANRGIEFNMIQFNLKNSTEENKTIFVIDFKHNQFMIKGNILFDRVFFKWYLEKVYKFVLTDDDKYTYSFLDHTMNFIDLPEYCYIMVNKDGYDVINDVEAMRRTSEAETSACEAAPAPSACEAAPAPEQTTDL